MLRQAWNEYRGWAKLARNMQDATRRWNLAALVCVVVAAICGAATMLFPDSGGATNPIAVTLAGAATLAAAVGAFFGREILSAGKEGDWIQARATGEGLKSECFRFAAKAHPYDGADADALKAFEARMDELARQATTKGLVSANNPVPSSGDKYEPPVPLTTDWYKKNNRRSDHLLPICPRQERGHGQPPLVGGFRRWPRRRRLRGARRLGRATLRALDWRHDDDRCFDCRLWPA